MMYQYSLPMAMAKEQKLKMPDKPALTTTEPKVIFIFATVNKPVMKSSKTHGKNFGHASAKLA